MRARALSTSRAVRLADRFGAADPGTALAKFVRANHVQTDEHWRFQTVTPSRLAVDALD
jgi:hypothetical protein